MNIRTLTGIAVAVLSVGALAAGPAMAHDSNTLHKIGSAIQYPVRKMAENLSIDMHRSEQRRSVESMRPQREEAVVIPNGKQFVVHHRSPTMWAHRRGQFYTHRTEHEQRPGVWD